MSHQRSYFQRKSKIYYLGMTSTRLTSSKVQMTAHNKVRHRHDPSKLLMLFAYLNGDVTNSDALTTKFLQQILDIV